MIWVVVLIAVIIPFGYLVIRYNYFTPSVKGLPILMYHMVKEEENSGLSISIDRLEKQFEYLKQKGYKTIHFNELISILNKKDKVHKNTIILTFDDAYLNNYVFLYPMLKKYGFKATIMLPVAHIGKMNAWDGSTDEIMSFKQLKELDNELVEYGLHSYEHINYRHASIDSSDKDLEKAIEGLKSNDLKFTSVLAYPYGGFPRKNPDKSDFFKMLERKDIQLGLRIGNKINRMPLKNKYEVCRIDIRGTDSFRDFVTKVKKGRVKLF